MILGFVVAEIRRKSGHIITIDVVAEARRAGVGSALLRAAEDQLLRAGARAVALETPVNNAAAIRFYKQKGYFVEKTVRGILFWPARCLGHDERVGAAGGGMSCRRGGCDSGCEEEMT